MVPRWKQQLGGVFIALLCGGATVWTWTSAQREGSFSLKAAMIFPVFFVMGVGMVLFPTYREERLARGEDISGLQGAALITPRWWGIMAVGFVAAGLFIALLKGWV